MLTWKYIYVICQEIIKDSSCLTNRINHYLFFTSSCVYLPIITIVNFIIPLWFYVVLAHIYAHLNNIWLIFSCVEVLLKNIIPVFWGLAFLFTKCYIFKMNACSAYSYAHSVFTTTHLTMRKIYKFMWFVCYVSYMFFCASKFRIWIVLLLAWDYYKEYNLS